MDGNRQEGSAWQSLEQGLPSGYWQASLSGSGRALLFLAGQAVFLKDFSSHTREAPETAFHRI